MNIRSAIAAVPWLRKAWRMLPGPLKLPLVLVALVYVIWRWRRDDEEDAGALVEGARSGDRGPEASAGGS